MQTASRLGKPRPKLVWVIFLGFVISAGYTLLSLLLVYSGATAITPEQAAYLRGLSVLDHGLTLAIAGLNFAGAISLFLLRKAALYLFVASLVLTLGITVIQVINTGLLAALSGMGIIGMLIGYALLAAVCMYARRLKARGVLV